MNNQEEYRIEQFNEKKVIDLEKLYSEVYKKKSPPSYFKKKYSTAYTGIFPIALIAYKEEAPVAFLATITCFIQYEGSKIHSAQLVDGMTHPEHRHKGLYSTLCEKCSGLCKQNGIKIIYGFPNQDSYQPTLKLGWKLTGFMHRFTIPVHVSLFKKIFNKLIGINTVKTFKNYILDENGLKSSALKNGFCGVLRDENYLRYKQYSRTFVLKIANSKIWISLKNGLSIGDIETDGNTFDELITTTKEIAAKLGCNAIYFQVCSDTFLFNLFKERFDSLPSFPVIFKPLDEAIDVKKIKFTFADIDIF